MLGVQESATVNSVIVVLKVSVLLVFVALGISAIHPANWTPFIPPNEGGFRYGVPGIFRAASVIFFAYVGFEAVSTASAEAKNPKRDVPIGIITSLGICTVIYVCVAAVMTGVVPYKQLGVADPLAVLHRGFDEVSGPIAPALRSALRDRLGGDGHPSPDRSHDGSGIQGSTAPPFAEALIRQPRAGATCPGKPRLILEPPENHGDHCLVVAVLGTVLAGHYGADPATAFLAGMAHHLHNATLPDSGFAGEILLGDELAPLMRRLFDRELATLAPPVAAAVRTALATIADADTPEGRAFNGADVMDRVLQMRQYDRVAAFNTAQALDDLDLVHAGPIQAFHHAVLAEAGLP